MLGYHPMTVTWILVALSTFSLFAAYLTPFFMRRVGSALGWYLRRKTEGRRASLLEVMEEDEKAYLEKQTAGEKTLDGDWENVEAYALGSSPNGQTGEKQWDGIVGFFHPFW